MTMRMIMITAIIIIYEYCYCLCYIFISQKLITKDNNINYQGMKTLSGSLPKGNFIERWQHLIEIENVY